MRARAKPKATAKTTTTNPDHLDLVFYMKAYKDINRRFVDPFKHYYSVGRDDDRLPNELYFKKLYPLFDMVVYRRENGDLSSLSNEELMSHFHHHGRFECRVYRES
jgi:hypothetical protein